MIEQVQQATKTKEHILENLFEKGPFKLNHVVIKPGQVFPKHNTDADVYIIIVKGKLTLQLADEASSVYEKRQVVHVPYNTPSELSNKSEKITEAYVVKMENQ